METTPQKEKLIQQDYLHKKLLIQGKIGIWGGLHIGGSNTAMDIGGLNAEVVRDPATGEPYIPGSSLKGKLRSLLETWYGHIGSESMNNAVKNGPCVHPDAPSARLFGYIKSSNGRNKEDSRATKANPATTRDTESEPEQKASRLIVRDAYLMNAHEIGEKTDLLYTQSKTEVVIDRITAGAMPRTMERVPRLAIFHFEMIVNILESEKEQEANFLLDLWCAMSLLQDDYLGGKGSRGSGQVDIWVTNITERPRSWYRNQTDENRKYLDNCKLPLELQNFSHPFEEYEISKGSAQ